MFASVFYNTQVTRFKFVFELDGIRSCGQFLFHFGTKRNLFCSKNENESYSILVENKRKSTLKIMSFIIRRKWFLGLSSKVDRLNSHGFSFCLNSNKNSKIFIRPLHNLTKSDTTKQIYNSFTKINHHTILQTNLQNWKVIDCNSSRIAVEFFFRFSKSTCALSPFI